MGKVRKIWIREREGEEREEETEGERGGPDPFGEIITGKHDYERNMRRGRGKQGLSECGKKEMENDNDNDPND